MTVGSAFARAADYDRHARLQASVASALADRIAALPLPACPRVLEIGCGTGLLGAALVDRLAGARWLMTDLSAEMVERARQRFAGRPTIAFEVLDGEQADAIGRYDLICSSLAAQWFDDLPRAVTRLAAALAPGGWLALTTLIEGSFAEWHDAHGALASGVRTYPNAAALTALGLGVEVTPYAVRHADARDFLRSVKAIGAGTARPGHRPLSPSQLRGTMARFDASGAVVTYVVATCLLRHGA